MFLKYHFSGNFQILPIKQDGSLRRYFRVKNESQTQVLLYWRDATEEKAQSFLLFQDFFLKQKVNLPHLFHFSKEKNLFLMEDLTDMSLEKKAKSLKAKNASLKPLYKKALFEMIKIHSSFLTENRKGKKVLDKRYKNLFKETLNQTRLMKEVKFTLFHLIEKLFGAKLSQMEDKILQKTFLNLCQSLDQEEKRVSHRDYHSRNLMIKEEKVRVIDFQDALLAPLHYDLASLLFDSYTEVRESLREDLMEEYLLNVEGKEKWSREKFKKTLYIQSLQRNFKACGSFASFYNLKQDGSYLKYVPLCFQSIERLLEHLNEYKDFLSLIQDRGWSRKEQAWRTKIKTSESF